MELNRIEILIIYFLGIASGIPIGMKLSKIVIRKYFEDALNEIKKGR